MRRFFDLGVKTYCNGVRCIRMSRFSNRTSVFLFALSALSFLSVFCLSDPVVAGTMEFRYEPDQPKSSRLLFDQLSVEEIQREMATSREGENSTDRTILGQHRKSRKQRGGGALWVDFYMADTAIEDARDIPDYCLRTKPDMWGAQIGYDLKLGPGGTSRFGVFYNYNSTYMKWGVDWAPNPIVNWERWLANNHLVGLMYTDYGALTHVIVRGSVGYDSYDLALPGTGPENPDTGDRYPDLNYDGDGMQANLYTEFGLDFVLDDQTWAIKPYLAFDYNYLYIDNMEDGFYGFTTSKEVHNAFKSILGIRVNKTFGRFIEIQGRFAWIQQLLQEDAPISNLYFSNINGTMTPTQYLSNTIQGRSFAWIGASSKFYVGRTGMRVILDYDLMLNACNLSHIGNVGLLFTW